VAGGLATASRPTKKRGKKSKKNHLSSIADSSQSIISQNSQYSKRDELKDIVDAEATAAHKAALAAKRAKHVGKACIHCKKAHLACDSARPCKRCFHLGKLDCVDVEHKRRGRPRNAPDKDGSTIKKNTQYNGSGIKKERATKLLKSSQYINTAMITQSLPQAAPSAESQYERISAISDSSSHTPISYQNDSSDNHYHTPSSNVGDSQQQPEQSSSSLQQHHQQQPSLYLNIASLPSVLMAGPLSKID